MKVLVDTPIWSFALRRREVPLPVDVNRHVREWTELIRERRVLLLGPVRQELLSGIREEASFERLRLRLRAFDDVRLAIEDFEEAARCGNRCRAAGVAGSTVDYLICAVALGRGASIYTADHDFERYARLLPIRLHSPRP